MIGLSPSKKRVVKILQDVSGIIRPSRLVNFSEILVWFSVFFFSVLTSRVSSIDLLFYRMTLLLGPPASGKTTFLKALSGETDDDLRV